MATTSELQLEDRLRSICSNIDPSSLALFLSERLKKYGDPTKPPWELTCHYVSRLLSATCAYHKSYRAKPITPIVYHKLFNALHEHHDEYLSEIIIQQNDLDRMILALYGEQIQLQDKIELSDEFRVFYILSQSPRIVNYDTEISDRIGGSIHHMILLCILLQQRFSSPSQNSLSLVEIDPIFNCAFPGFDWKRAVSLLLQTINQCGKEYLDRRDSIRSQIYKGYARSVFLDKPLLEIEGERIVAPISNLIGRWVCYELQNIIMQMNSTIARQVRFAYQDYIGIWLEELNIFGHVTKEIDIPTVEGEKICDFLCQSEEAIILIEVKSSNTMPKYIIAESLRNHTLIERTCQGINQLSRVAERIRKGCITGINLGNRKLYGIVVVLGEVPGINSKFGGNTIINPQYAKKFDIKDFELFDYMPQVIDNHAFEKVCCYLSATKLSFRQLLKERDKNDYVKVGDWRGLIENLRKDIDLKYPSFVQSGTKLLREELDAAAERIKSMA